jgi:hypothetical protein
VADVGAATGTARSPSRSFAYHLILALSALDAAGRSVIATVLPIIIRALDLDPAAARRCPRRSRSDHGRLPNRARWIQTRSAESLRPISALVVAAGLWGSGP